MASVYLAIAGLLLMVSTVTTEVITTCLQQKNVSATSDCHHFQISCNATEYIHIQQMFYELVSGQSCPPPPARKCRDQDGCCVSQSQYECSGSYSPAAMYSMYVMCSAERHCQGVADVVTDVTQVCDVGSRGPPTGGRAGGLLPLVSVIHYECVDATKFIDFCSNTMQTITASIDHGLFIHVIHRHDSDNIDKTSPISCTCSVVTEPGSDVNVWYQDIRLHRHSPSKICSSASFVDNVKMGCVGSNPAASFTTSSGPKYTAKAANVTLDGVYSKGEADTPDMVWISFQVNSGVTLIVTCTITAADSGTDDKDEDEENDGGDPDEHTVANNSAINVTAIVVSIVCVLLIIAVILVTVLIWRRRKRNPSLPTGGCITQGSYRETTDEVYSTIIPDDVLPSRNNSYCKIEGDQLHTQRKYEVDGYDKINPASIRAMSSPIRDDYNKTAADGYNKLNYKSMNDDTDKYSSHNIGDDSVDKSDDFTPSYNKLVHDRRYNPDTQSTTQEINDYDKTATAKAFCVPITDGNNYNRLQSQDYNKINLRQLPNEPPDASYSHLNTNGVSETLMRIEKPSGNYTLLNRESQQHIDDVASGEQRMQNSSSTISQVKPMKRTDSYEYPDATSRELANTSLHANSGNYETAQEVEQSINISNNVQIANTIDNAHALSESTDECSVTVFNSGDIKLPTKYKDDSDTSSSYSGEDTDDHTNHTYHMNSTHMSEETGDNINGSTDGYETQHIKL